MKRKVGSTEPSPRIKKRPTVVVPDYCDVTMQQDADGEYIWPAPKERMERARSFIRECAESGRRTLIVPDKDADGLSSGVIVYRTLEALGLDSSLIDVHLLSKGTTVHSESQRQLMLEKKPERIIVLDQGSRSGPRIVDDEEVKCLVIDHHNATDEDRPDGAEFISACSYPPVATASLLTYELCKPLNSQVASECGYLCTIGTIGDLGQTLKWKPPFPDMTEVFKTHTKKAISGAVSLINAPRRTATFDVESAWDALLNTQTPKEILSNPRLREARAEINDEVERYTHAPPKFSKDGKIAVLRINSAAQVHPVIATRWAGFLKSKALEIVMVANSGHLPGMTNFSCRIARCALDKDPPVNIIESLKAVANLSTTDLTTRMGEDFARGHKEASGGIVPHAEFEEFMTLMKVGEKPDLVPGAEGKKKSIKVEQKNTLNNYFSKA